MPKSYHAAVHMTTEKADFNGSRRFYQFGFLAALKHFHSLSLL